MLIFQGVAGSLEAWPFSLSIAWLVQPTQKIVPSRVGVHKEYHVGFFLFLGDVVVGSEIGRNQVGYQVITTHDKSHEN